MKLIRISNPQIGMGLYSIFSSEIDLIFLLSSSKTRFTVLQNNASRIKDEVQQELLGRLRKQTAH